MKTRKVKLTNSFHSGFTFFSFYEYNFVTLIFLGGFLFYCGVCMMKQCRKNIRHYFCLQVTATVCRHGATVC